ncbi:hypothetical protein [Subtercola frigoramans]|uniref:Amino acid transporter n=1 Tax=Subtercola frigoramans TaxID=120298 RepID=A0ABS2L5J1_9MICO|nr:hypothetical protein [Subtercola frigoramans]MBM7472349.1 amino acid transporter [Subtercola frigoramans]
MPKSRPSQRSSSTAQRSPESRHPAVAEKNRGRWGAFAALITLALIAFPLSATIAFATNPASQKLFGGRLEDASRGGYITFWWLMSLLIVSLPFLVGFGITKLSSRGPTIVGGIVALFVIVIVILGQLFVY